MMRSDDSTNGPQGARTMKEKTAKPQMTQAAPPRVATGLPPGYVEAQHQITGEPYVPGTVPTKKAPGAI